MPAATFSRTLYTAGLAFALLGALVAFSPAQADERTALPRDGGSQGGMMHAGMGHGPHGASAGDGAMMGLMGGRGLERLLDSVNATADQRRQIAQISDAARQDMQQQHRDRRGLRDEWMALFSQPTVDARAAESLRARMVAQHDAGSKRAMQAMLEISRVLTPEQRQGLAERMKQRQARHGMPGEPGAAPGVQRP